MYVFLVDLPFLLPAGARTSGNTAGIYPFSPELVAGGSGHRSSTRALLWSTAERMRTFASAVLLNVLAESNQRHHLGGRLEFGVLFLSLLFVLRETN